MTHGGWRWMALAAGLLAATSVQEAGAGTIVLPRAGQVGVGVQGGWGTLLRSGELGGEFGNGPTLGIRLRYRMRYERALGLSFEGQRFEIRVPESEFPVGLGPGTGRTHVRAILSGIEFYQMFGTRTRATRMIMVGAGLAQTEGGTQDKDTFFPGDGSYVSAGFGVERFVVGSWALDLSGRYMLVFRPGDRSHDLQVALGFMRYFTS